MAQDQAFYEDIPNGTENLSIYSDNDIGTYRDVLYYVGQVLGGFFVINRAGQLELRKYGNTPVLTVERRHRFTSSFSDFITKYTAVSSTNLKTQTAEYYALETDDGLTMNLGVNPLLQFGLDETRHELITNILNDIAVVNYVPFDSDTIGNPALDLGDVLQFTGGQADAAKMSAVTSMSCKIGGKMGLRGVGKNPRLARAKSKNDKNISGLINQIEAGKIGIHTFTNASAFTVNDTDVKIISIQFASSEQNHAQFFGQIIIDAVADTVSRSAMVSGNVVIPSVEVNSAEADPEAENTLIGTTAEQIVEVELPVSWTEDGQAIAYVTFELNDEIVEIHHPMETWHSGKHTMLLYYPVERIIPNYTNTFNVYLRMDSGSASIDVGGVIASISGQSMAAGDAWDGTINLSDSITRLKFGGNLRTKALTDGMNMEYRIVHNEALSEVLAGRTGIGAFARPFILEG